MTRTADLDTEARPSRRARMVDIARAAGVSLATVDRVINGRSGVDGRTAERVLEAAARLDYSPNLAAQSLSRRAGWRFDFVLPAGSNTFMAMLDEAIAATAAEFATFGVVPRRHLIEGFNPEALAAALRRIGRDSDGIAVVALEHPSVREAVNDLVAAGVPVATLVTDLSPSRRIGYVGVDNRAAGRTAGLLMGRFLGGRAGKVAVIAGSVRYYRGHEEREMGFRRVLRESFRELEIVTLLEGHDDWARNREQAERLLAEHRDLLGLYNIGGGARGIAEALQAAGGPGRVVFIGHELTAHTRRFLIDGVMDAVISQDPRQEAAATVRLLLNHHTRRADHRIEPTRIEIFVKENLP